MKRSHLIYLICISVLVVSTAFSDKGDDIVSIQTTMK